MTTTTTITLRGDRDYVNRLKKLAALRETDIADLVRSAIDSTLGDQLRKVDQISDSLELASTQVSSVEAK